uniref:Uncharacterized protein n=1 Tax=Anguilla anguilla TaxID=7936 RepID=A0A0E9PBW2_ANGAN
MKLNFWNEIKGRL